MSMIADMKFAGYYLSQMLRKLPSRTAKQSAKKEYFQAGFNRGVDHGIRRAKMYYPGADNGVLNGDWSTSINSCIDVIRKDFSGLCARSELAYRTSAIARRVVDILTQFVVGQGNRPHPVVMDQNGEPIEAINSRLAADWERFNDQSIRMCNQHLTDYQAQQVDFRTVVTYGSALFNRIPSKKGSLLPYAFQTLKPYRLDFSKDTVFSGIDISRDAERIIHGMKLSDYGEAQKFYFTDGTEYTTENMNLCFYPIESEQYLGLPWLTPVLPQIWDHQQLFDDKMKQSRIGAKLGIKISQNDVGALNNLMTTDPDTGYQYLDLDFQGLYGGKDKPEPISITDPISDTFKALVDMIMQYVAIGLGFSYQLFTTDLAGANFSSGRINTINENLGFRTLYKWYTKARSQVRWQEFVRMEVMTGRLSDLGVTMAEYNRDSWMFNQCFHLPMDGREWVDPLKDAQALILAYRTGQITYQEMCSKTGKNWTSVVKQLQTERKLLTEAGMLHLLPENIDNQNQNVNTQEQNSDENTESSQKNMV